MIRMDRLGPDILSVLIETESTCLATCASALKRGRLVISLYALMTRKLWGEWRLWEDIVSVSGSFWSSLKVLRMMFLTASLVGWKVPKGEWNSLPYIEREFWIALFPIASLSSKPAIYQKRWYPASWRGSKQTIIVGSALLEEVN